MSGHLTEDILESIRMRKLAPDTLMAVDDHLSGCAVCREAVGASLVTAVASERFVTALIDNDHLQYEELEAYVDESLSADEQTRVTRHLEICDQCRNELHELQAFAAPQSVKQKAEPGWLAPVASIFRRPVPIFLSLIALLSIGGLVWFGMSNNSAVPRESAGLGGETPPVEAETPAANFPAPSADAPADESTFTIDDGGETLAISGNSELSGYASVPSNYRRLVANALVHGRVALPDLRDLKSPAGVLMGRESPAAGTFRLYSPVGQVLNTATPRFSWQAVPNSEKYVVEIFDRDFNQVATSGELKNTSWKQKLAEGKTYSWQVTAVVEGKVLKAPLQPQPEARFRILDRKTINNLSALRASHPRSHLLLGTAYANAGLVEDAIREFELLAKTNPDRELPKQLLRQLKALK